MPKLIPTNGEHFKCSACEQIFSPPPVPRGARPWTADEAKAKLAGQFREHIEKAHFPFDSKGSRGRIRPEERH